MIDGGSTDNGIGNYGAKIVAQALQNNTTLTALYLNGLPPKHVPIVSFPILLFMHCVCSGNIITDDGKRVLESMTYEDTLTVLSV